MWCVLRLKQIANQSSSSCSHLGHLHRICLSLLFTVAYPSSLPNLSANEIRGDAKVKYCSSFHLLQSLCPLRLLPILLLNCQTYVTVAGGLLCSELTGEKKIQFLCIRKVLCKDYSYKWWLFMLCWEYSMIFHKLLTFRDKASWAQTLCVCLCFSFPGRGWRAWSERKQSWQGRTGALWKQSPFISLAALIFTTLFRSN